MHILQNMDVAFKGSKKHILSMAKKFMQLWGPVPKDTWADNAFHKQQDTQNYAEIISTHFVPYYESLPYFVLLLRVPDKLFLLMVTFSCLLVT